MPSSSTSENPEWAIENSADQTTTAKCHEPKGLSEPELNIAGTLHAILVTKNDTCVGKTPAASCLTAESRMFTIDKRERGKNKVA
jgi:hypothetical protein